MARISAVDDAQHPELAELAGRLRGGRGGRLLSFYKLLLHSPEVAESWYEHVSAVRWKTQLDGQTRELVIIRIALLNRVEYVVKAHVPAYAVAEGLTVEQCDALTDWQASTLFSPLQRAALAYTDAMTRDVQVPDTVFEELRTHFNERQIVELTVLIGTYNMHTRVLQALQTDLEPTMSPS